MLFAQILLLIALFSAMIVVLALTTERLRTTRPGLVTAIFIVAGGLFGWFVPELIW